MNIGTSANMNTVRNIVGFGKRADKKQSSAADISDSQFLIIRQNDELKSEQIEIKRANNERWTSEPLYKIDVNSPKGYTIDQTALDKVRERLEAEDVAADKRSPTHEVTDEQIEWLSERYDMDFLNSCCVNHSEFGNFMLDLAYLNVFSLDEVKDVLGVMPFNANNKAIVYTHKDPSKGIEGGFSSSDSGIVGDYQDLLAQMNVDYLKYKNAEELGSETLKKSEDLKTQSSIITDIFARFFENRKNAEMNSSLTYPIIEDASDKLKDDFGSRL